MTAILTRYAAAAPARTDRLLAGWLIATAAMTVAMVVIGGITRLTQSGLSITEWQPVSGILPPLSDAAWQQEFDHYRQIPEYRQIHAGMNLDEFKQIFFWEYLHRLVGRLTGFVALLPPLVFVMSGRIPMAQLPRLLTVPVLVGLQGLLGWYMVESGLAVRTSVSQYRLAAHLALALALYAYCVWQAATLLTRQATAAPRLRFPAGLVLVLVACTILAGAFTAGTKAGLVYNTFPLMDGRLVPDGYWTLSPWWRNPFENVTAVQFDHRVLAMLTLLAVLFYYLRARTVLPGPAAWLLAASLLQVGLGVSTLLGGVPVALAAAHQLGGVFLLTAALVNLHRTMKSGQPGLASGVTSGGIASLRT